MIVHAEDVVISNSLYRLSGTSPLFKNEIAYIIID